MNIKHLRLRLILSLIVVPAVAFSWIGVVLAREGHGGSSPTLIFTPASQEVFSGPFSGSWGNYTGSVGCQWSLSYSGTMTLNLVQNADGTVNGTGDVPTNVNIVVIFTPANTTCTASPFSTTATGPVSGTNGNLTGTFAGSSTYRVNFMGSRSGDTITGSAIFSATLQSNGTPVPVSSSASIKLNLASSPTITLPKSVRYWSQGGSARWANDTYDHKDCNLDPKHCRMRQSGCALTALAMALDYAGVVTDPGFLNAFMEQDYKHRFTIGTKLVAGQKTIQAGVNFKATTGDIVDYLGTGPSTHFVFNENKNWKTTADIESILRKGFPVILGVKLDAHNVPSHYVLVTGKQDGKFLINDPGHYNYVTLDAYQNSFIIRGYVSPAPPLLPINVLNSDKSSDGTRSVEATDLSALVLSAGDNAELQVIDEAGRRTGYDPTTGTTLNEIPNSTYAGDSFEDDETGEVFPEVHHTLSIDGVMQGVYTVIVAGRQPGPYEIAISSYAQDGSPQRESSIIGTSSINSINSYQIYVAPLTSNPVDQAQFFVWQQYLDFLNRVPDSGGLSYWSGQITQCGGNAQCIHDRRVGTADAFFFEDEFQKTGAYIYRVYRTAMAQRPAFAQFSDDRGQVVAGSGLDQSKTAYALAFAQRDAFLQLYPRTQTAAQFVDALLNSIKQSSQVDLTSQRSSLLSLYDGTDNGRAAILRQVADNPLVIDAEYNSSFVLMEYFGYLRRDPDQGGFDFWLGQVNKYPLRNTDIQHAMACSFITSAEYQQRFGSVVSHTNQECPQ